MRRTNARANRAPSTGSDAPPSGSADRADASAAQPVPAAELTRWLRRRPPVAGDNRAKIKRVA
jgi:hypothetical protein